MSAIWPHCAKWPLLTGACAGIGKAVVRRLPTDGWTVYGATRRTDRMAGIQAEGAHLLAWA